MDTLEILVYAAMGSVLVFGSLGAWVGTQKNRGNAEGLILGALLGPFGVLIEALLPTIDEPGRKSN